MRAIASLVTSLVFCAACELDCAPYDVLRVDLSPIQPIPPGETRLWTTGAGGFKWPSSSTPPIEAETLSALVIRGEPSAGTIRISAVLETERLLFVELPATLTASRSFAVNQILGDVEFTGGYGDDYGWWSNEWRHFLEERPVSASIVDPFSETWSAVTSSGTITVLDVAPLRLSLDIATTQKSGPAERVRAEGKFSLEEQREVCAR